MARVVKRVYAAYGAIYIAASLLWLGMVERQRPTVAYFIGGIIAIIRGPRHCWLRSEGALISEASCPECSVPSVAALTG